MTTTVLLVDEHPVVREGLRGMIDAEHDLNVVAEAGSGAEPSQWPNLCAPM
jgi:DNA-binding NarL/FixJ family response regulator